MKVQAQARWGIEELLVRSVKTKIGNLELGRIVWVTGRRMERACDLCG